MRNRLFLLFTGLLLLSVASVVRSQPDDGKGQPPQKRQKGAKPETEKNTPPPVVDLNLRGKLEKMEHKLEDGRTIALYMLVLPDGLKVRLPAQDDLDYRQFADLQVAVNGQGIVIEEKGRKFYSFKKVLKVEKVEEAGTPMPGPGASTTEPLPTRTEVQPPGSEEKPADKTAGQ
ncbi:MAG: hypothetical protein N2255_01830 [Kiritimatiellae bacterium]|nr:hypothetical protein [Kiritimatiellia bacterium]